MKKMWLDVETTGLGSHDKIVEICCLFENENQEIIQEFHEYICYDEYPENAEEAFQINGLSKEYLEESGIGINTAMINLIETINKTIVPGKEKLTICGYCVGFDIGFLKKEMDELFYNYFEKRNIDVYSKVKDHILENNINLENKRLSTVSKHFGIAINAHSAESDIKATRQLYYKMLPDQNGRATANKND